MLQKYDWSLNEEHKNVQNITFGKYRRSNRTVGLFIVEKTYGSTHL